MDDDENLADMEEVEEFMDGGEDDDEESEADGQDVEPKQKRAKKGAATGRNSTPA